PTDNDERDVDGRWGEEGLASKWRKAGLHALTHRLDAFDVKHEDGRSVRIEAAVRIAPPMYRRAFLCRYEYTFFDTGEGVVTFSGAPQAESPYLPRIGVQLGLPGAMDRVVWYGRGPGESYVDSKEEGRVGLHRATVDDLFTSYVRPQENGNRTD